MKKILSLFVALFMLVAVSYAQKGVMKFTSETHDFGKVEQGKPVTHVFEFKNTGSDPVVINDAQASCGCTKPSWTSEPIMPGKTGTVSATYNAAANGAFNKTVTVISNAEAGQVVLRLKGEVVSKKEAETAGTPDAKDKKKAEKTSR